jgi:hypothetical protein
MYGWLIVNLHLQGYTQLTSRFYNQKHNIKFRTFYDTLLTLFKNDSVLGTIYTDVRNNIESLLYKGILPKNLSGHNLVFCNGHALYKHKSQIFSLVEQTVLELVHDDQQHKEISTLQQLAIFDSVTEYPVTVKSTVDLTNKSDQNQTYVFNSKVSKDDMMSFDNFYYTLRRKGALKNLMSVKASNVYS